MTEYMVVSRNQNIHGKWYTTEAGGPVRWMARSCTWTLTEWEPIPVETCAATLRRYRHPGWKIILAFYVDDRLGGLEPGMVMPGWIEGMVPDCLPIDFGGDLAPWW